YGSTEKAAVDRSFLRRGDEPPPGPRTGARRRGPLGGDRGHPELFPRHSGSAPGKFTGGGPRAMPPGPRLCLLHAARSRILLRLVAPVGPGGELGRGPLLGGALHPRWGAGGLVDEACNRARVPDVPEPQQELPDPIPLDRALRAATRRRLDL